MSVRSIVPVFLLLGVGCHNTAPSELPARTDTSHRFISARSEPAGHIAAGAAVSEDRIPRQVFNPAEPYGDLPDPMFPPEAVNDTVIPVTVGVRLVIDASGRIAQIGESRTVVTLPHPHQAEFRVAVEQAVSQWKFHPAEIRYLRPLPGPKDYWLVDRIETVEDAVEVLFTFSSTGVVRLDAVHL